MLGRMPKKPTEAWNEEDLLKETIHDDFDDEIDENALLGDSDNESEVRPSRNKFQGERFERSFEEEDVIDLGEEGCEGDFDEQDYGTEEPEGGNQQHQSESHVERGGETYTVIDEIDTEENIEDEQNGNDSNIDTSQTNTSQADNSQADTTAEDEEHQYFKDADSDSGSDDEDDNAGSRNRDRFKTERHDVVTTKATTDRSIPDSLDYKSIVSKEEQERVEKYEHDSKNKRNRRGRGRGFGGSRGAGHGPNQRFPIPRGGQHQGTFGGQWRGARPPLYPQQQQQHHQQQQQHRYQHQQLQQQQHMQRPQMQMNQGMNNQNIHDQDMLNRGLQKRDIHHNGPPFHHNRDPHHDREPHITEQRHREQSLGHREPQYRDRGPPIEHRVPPIGHRVPPIGHKVPRAHPMDELTHATNHPHPLDILTDPKLKAPPEPAAKIYINPNFKGSVPVQSDVVLNPLVQESNLRSIQEPSSQSFPQSMQGKTMFMNDQSLHGPGILGNPPQITSQVHNGVTLNGPRPHLMGRPRPDMDLRQMQPQARHPAPQHRPLFSDQDYRGGNFQDPDYRHRPNRLEYVNIDNVMEAANMFTRLVDSFNQPRGQLVQMNQGPRGAGNFPGPRFQGHLQGKNNNEVPPTLNGPRPRMPQQDRPRPLIPENPHGSPPHKSPRDRLGPQQQQQEHQKRKQNERPTPQKVSPKKPLTEDEKKKMERLERFKNPTSINIHAKKRLAPLPTSNTPEDDESPTKQAKLASNEPNTQNPTLKKPVKNRLGVRNTETSVQVSGSKSIKVQGAVQTRLGTKSSAVTSTITNPVGSQKKGVTSQNKPVIKKIALNTRKVVAEERHVKEETTDTPRFEFSGTQNADQEGMSDYDRKLAEQKRLREEVMRKKQQGRLCSRSQRLTDLEDRLQKQGKSLADVDIDEHMSDSIKPTQAKQVLQNPHVKQSAKSTTANTKKTEPQKIQTSINRNSSQTLRQPHNTTKATLGGCKEQDDNIMAAVNAASNKSAAIPTVKPLLRGNTLKRSNPSTQVQVPVRAVRKPIMAPGDSPTAGSSKVAINRRTIVKPGPSTTVNKNKSVSSTNMRQVVRRTDEPTRRVVVNPNAKAISTDTIEVADMNFALNSDNVKAVYEQFEGDITEVEVNVGDNKLLLIFRNKDDVIKNVRRHKRLEVMGSVLSVRPVPSKPKKSK